MNWYQALECMKQFCYCSVERVILLAEKIPKLAVDMFSVPIHLVSEQPYFHQPRLVFNSILPSCQVLWLISGWFGKHRAFLFHWRTCVLTVVLDCSVRYMHNWDCWNLTGHFSAKLAGLVYFFLLGQKPLLVGKVLQQLIRHKSTK